MTYLLPWFCLVATPQLEFKAEQAIKALGYQTVVPHKFIQVRGRYSAKRKVMPDKIYRPKQLMEGYVVVQAVDQADVCDLVYRLGLRHQRLIHRVLRMDGRHGPPSQVPQECVKHLIALSGMVEDLELKPARVPFKPGDTARIIEGYGMGQHAKIIQAKRHSALMLIEIFGGMQKVELAYSKLVRVADEQTWANQLHRPPTR
jgi:transcription antitermination factor NusG